MHLSSSPLESAHSFIIYDQLPVAHRKELILRSSTELHFPHSLFPVLPNSSVLHFLHVFYKVRCSMHSLGLQDGASRMRTVHLAHSTKDILRTQGVAGGSFRVLLV